MEPLYSWSAALDGGAVATAPKLVRVVLVFMKRQLDRGKFTFSCRRLAVASTEMFRTDAKCESSKIVLGGHEVSGKRWFCMVVTATDLPICFSRTMASLSGLRHLQNSWAHWWHYLECLVATSMLKGRLQRAVTDNRSNESTAAKASTTKWPLFLFHMQLSEHLMKAGVKLDLRWRPRDENEPADDLTNENFERFDMTLSLQSHCFMVARNLMRIIINNEISLIIIFRYCYNNIDIFDVSQKYQYFFKKITIFLTRIIIFLIIFFKKILLILGRNIIIFVPKYH